MLLIWMSIAGSIPLIMYLIIWALSKENLNYSLGKSLLVISMIFYVLPIQLLGRLLPDKICNGLRIFEAVRSSKIYIRDSNYISIEDGIMWVPEWAVYTLNVWMAFVITFGIYQVIKYKKSITYLIRDSKEESCEIENIGTINLLINDKITTAYTIGLLHSYIVFPRKLISSSIYKHEYCHAKNHDALAKLLCLIIMCIHWFNPLTVLLLISYSNLCEYISDSYATKGYTHEQRKQYAALLIDLCPTKVLPVVWRNNILSTKFLFERRIRYIMKKKNLRFGKLTAVIISMITIVMSSLTVFGYEPMQSTTENLVTGTSEEDFIEFTPDDEHINDYESVVDISFYTYEYVFISNDGEIVYPNLDSTYAICNHNFESGYVYKHVSNGNGGCTVYKYKAQRCTKCNYIKATELISTTTFVKCTHS